MERFLRVIDNLSQWSGKAFSFVLIAVVGTICIEVVMRYGLNSPTIWAQETMQYLSGVTYIFGGAYALYAGAHVKVEVLAERFGPRTRAVFDLITFPSFLIFAGALLWFGAEFAWDSILLKESTFSGWAPPIWPIKLTIPVGTLLLFLQGLAKFLRDFKIAVGSQHEH